MTGRIIRNISNLWTVLAENQKYECRAAGNIKFQKQVPLVGDMVEFDEENLYLKKILPRQSCLERPSVANVDQVLIITSVKNPDLDLYLLDKLLLICHYHRLTPIICFSKIDLLISNDEYNNIFCNYEKIGYIVLENTDYSKIKDLLKNKITVITGQSGAGKSSLLNKLDSNLNLKTNEISYSLGRGKHTTRHTELYEINSGFIVDTPGFSSLDITKIPKEDISLLTPEIAKYGGYCRFRDCSHQKEIGCRVKDEVINGNIMESRYQNYLKFYKERSEINDYR